MAQGPLIERAPGWAPLAARMPEALGRDPAIIEALRREFEAGGSQGWLTARGAILTRVEGSELVIIALEGADLAKLLPHIIERARRAGLTSMRAHTKKPGLLRLAQRIEPRIHQREIVLGMEL